MWPPSSREVTGDVAPLARVSTTVRRSRSPAGRNVSDTVLPASPWMLDDVSNAERPRTEAPSTAVISSP